MGDDNPAGGSTAQRRSLRDGPTDGITRLAYLSPTLLVSASWDGCVRVHDTLRDALVAMRSLNSPVLSLAVPIANRSNDASASSRTGEDGGSTSCFFAGTLDGSIYRLEVEGTTTEGASLPKLRTTLVGRHNAHHDPAASTPMSASSAAVSCLEAIATTVMVGAPPADDEPVTETEEGEEDENAVPRTLFVVAAAGWDKRFTLWDGGGSASSASASASASSSSETTANDNNNMLCEVVLPGKAFAMDACGVSGDSRGSTPVFRCVVATSGRRICVIDTPLPANATRRPSDDENDDPSLSSSIVLPDISAKLVLDRESSLKYQTRTVKFFPDGSGIAVSSIEGRVAIEYLTELGVDPHPDSGGGKKYAFKCHRKNELVFPVNCVEFHRDYPCVFVTGGADGTAVLWDGFARKKLAALGPDGDTSVSALALHPFGTELAIASSYTYERGAGEGDSELSKRNEIYIRALHPDEFQPKK